MIAAPFFSVVIPLYNKENHIKNTLKSVLAQSYTNFDIIIINDGSTDNSLSIVNSIESSKVSILHQKNLGLSAARNTGIKAAKYNYIAFLDADDLWCEDYLKTITYLIKADESAKVFSTSSAILRPKQKANLFATSIKPKHINIISNYFKHKKNLFSNSSLVVDKSVFEDVGYYDETINYGEEEDFFIRCFSKYKLVHYGAPKVYYLKGIDNQLTSPKNKVKKVIPDYSKYLNKGNYKVLKPYIDFVYFKFLVLQKMERNKVLVRKYKNEIDASNLSIIQKIKFYMPTQLFYYSKSFYINFLKSI